MHGLREPCATERSSASKKAHEKSERVLMFVEYALRRSASTISSVAATSALRITSNVIGSKVSACHPYSSLAAFSDSTLPSRTSSRDALRIALARVAPAAAACGAMDVDVARRRSSSRTSRAAISSVPSGRMQDVRRERAGLRRPPARTAHARSGRSGRSATSRASGTARRARPRARRGAGRRRRCRARARSARSRSGTPTRRPRPGCSPRGWPGS